MSQIGLGFSEATIGFLWKLRLNNNPPWFEAHKHDYQQYLLDPMKSLVAELAGPMSNLDPLLEVTPAVNKTISRIYRDIRFSKDKSPYRDRIWITFKRRIKDWQDTPAYFFEITPEFYRFGMGFYQASKATMDFFRSTLLEKPDYFRTKVSFLNDPAPNMEFKVEGERYKRISMPNISEELQEWFRLKSFFIVCKRPIDERLFQRELVTDLINGFTLLEPLYKYLWRTKELSV